MRHDPWRGTHWPSICCSLAGFRLPCQRLWLHVCQRASHCCVSLTAESRTPVEVEEAAAPGSCVRSTTGKTAAGRLRGTCSSGPELRCTALGQGNTDTREKHNPKGLCPHCHQTHVSLSLIHAGHTAGSQLLPTGCHKLSNTQSAGALAYWVANVLSAITQQKGREEESLAHVRSHTHPRSGV